MLRWTEDAWDDYLYWQTQGRRTLRRVNALIRDTMRSPFAGLVSLSRSNGNCRARGAGASIPRAVWCTWSMVVTCASCPCATTTEHWGCGRFLGDYRIEQVKTRDGEWRTEVQGCLKMSANHRILPMLRR